ncbi:MAG: rRNA cytosine-C5-methyltransferase [Tannerella sp.]|jgi:16S rRNA C967 or C1407 C5-methylase (RsmB/RsmF family)/NOL1/NOP2/fmu family ribosome biogenesis protein|nr:rRNA cytosine-C5-methyltransferase [Tannerella sp.]
MLPQEFIRRTKELLHGEYDALETALTSQPPVSFRVNPRKFPVHLLQDLQNPVGNTSGRYEKVPWCETGYYLQERPSFTFDPLFHTGSYYVQEASSMFIEQAFLTIIADAVASTRKPLIVLDLCAAPGGKSTHLLTLLPEGSLLVGNEVIRSRSVILAENMAKWGRADHIVTNNDPIDFGKLKPVFDIILADLPCSGEGMFRKNPTGRNEWSIDSVKLCALRQKRIILDVWDALRPGGWLVYSTCTFNTEENEDNVYELARKLRAEIVPIPVTREWDITGSLRHDIPAYRFFPHRTRGEGFFLALMRKNKGAEDAGMTKTKYKNRKQSASVPAEIKRMLLEPDRFAFFMDGGVYALPEIHKNACSVFSETLDIISSGIRMGEFRSKDFVPSVSLALSSEINPGAFPSIELSYGNAIRYLQKEVILLPENTSKGYILVTYKNIPLGFVKNIGTRANNLYPQEWRIRKRTV